MIDLLFFPIIAGCIVAAIAAPLGAFVMWNRMVYFGDTLAHCALLGVAFAFALTIHSAVAIVLVCVGIAITLWVLQNSTMLANDTLLGIISHSALALGLVAVSLLSEARIDLYAYLFGDLLTVVGYDLIIIASSAILIAIGLFIYWRQFLMMTIDEGLAKVEGVNVKKVRLILMIMIALLIGIAMKVVGILLITALLIIPAATARNVARSPEALVFFAGALGIASIFSGLSASFYLDTPPGASIVISNTAFFIIVQLFSRRTMG